MKKTQPTPMSRPLVARIFSHLGGGPEVDICPGGCGIEPSFTATAVLSACDNELTVTAVDALGHEASVTSTVTFNAQPPVLSGCEAVTVEIEPGETGAEVSCTAVDECGGTSQCAFPVTVTSCQPVEPDVRAQGFWKRQCQGPHPSGEHDNLPGYVDFVNGNQTFLDVADVDALCDRLDPRPRNDKCEQAEAQLMAAALNLASGRLAGCNCLDDPDLGAATAGEATSFADGLLANPGRTFDDCVLAQAIADRVNGGETPVDCQ